jgi:hypothetical protein
VALWLLVLGHAIAPTAPLFADNAIAATSDEERKALEGQLKDLEAQMDQYETQIASYEHL